MRSARGLACACALAAACKTAPPSAELVDARAAYAKAAQGPAKDLVPEKLLEARQALDSAEKRYRESNTSELAKTLAYIAHRRTLGVVAAAGIADAQRIEQKAEREYQDLLEASIKRSRDRLGKTEKSLEAKRIELAKKELELRENQTTLQEKEKQLEKEKAARAVVEARLATMTKSLEQVAKVKEDERGTIITLAMSGLFKANESTLLPIAGGQLRRIAEALDAYDAQRSIVVASHTDSAGSADANRALSQSRAEVVRAFLLQNGIASERIRAVGVGEDEPLADNSTPEGRTANRRVEIIVEPAPKN